MQMCGCVHAKLVGVFPRGSKTKSIQSDDCGVGGLFHSPGEHTQLRFAGNDECKHFERLGLKHSDYLQG